MIIIVKSIFGTSFKVTVVKKYVPLLNAREDKIKMVWIKW